MAGVLIRGFDFDTDDATIRRHCAAAGQVVSIQRKSKGCAMVTYKSEVVAARAVTKLDQSTIPGNARYIDAQQKTVQGMSSAAKSAVQSKHKVAIKPVTGQMAWNTPGARAKAPVPASKQVIQPGAKKRAVAAEPTGDGKSCYVRGMDHDTVQQDILDHLGSAGEILSSKFGKKNSSVLVTYVDKESAAIAVDSLNGTTIPGNERYIDVFLHKGENSNNRTAAKKQKAGKDKGPSGPDLERERLTSGPVTGKVVSFGGHFGWIHPDEPFEHETANKHKGKIYVHKQDVAAGSLEKDQAVQFEVFVDASGLGAEDVV